MENEKILDVEKEVKKTFTRKSTYLILFFIIGLIVSNLLISYFLPLSPEGITHLDGTQTATDELNRALKNSILFYYPLFAFILGVLIALIPYKKMPYRTKYLRFSLIIVLLLESFVFIGVLVIYMGSLAS